MLLVRLLFGSLIVCVILIALYLAVFIDEEKLKAQGGFNNAWEKHGYGLHIYKFYESIIQENRIGEIRTIQHVLSASLVLIAVLISYLIFAN
ncbi:hypothetical protein A9Q81_27460 [Gammaproteobacteria bacterium 42_54_T18]|nr:hypothetical protein A9Q81_27460 [Gammaproteobacteria bacterium 42_54_T18]